jgi:hypothetical protein
VRRPADLDCADECPGQPGQAEGHKQKVGAQQHGAVVWAKEIVLRETAAGESAPGVWVGDCIAALAVAMSPAGKDTTICGVAVGPLVRTLARGRRIAAARAATQTAFRWLAGPVRINRQVSAATAAVSGICQRELSKKVSRERLIVSMLFLPRARQQLLNLREFLRGQVSSFHQVQHQAIG